MARAKRAINELTESPALTPDERTIVDRVISQDTEWHKTITEDELNDFSLSADPYGLPDKAAKLQHERVYAFRWCERKPEIIDTYTKSAPLLKRWTLVTRTTLPALEGEVDGILGCVSCLDQCLLFRPWSFHARDQELKTQRAESRLRAGSIEGKAEKIGSEEGIKAAIGDRAKINQSDIIMYDEAQSDAGAGDLVGEEE
jgi:hypothetical protein